MLQTTLTLRFCKYRKSSGLDDVIAHGLLDKKLLHSWLLTVVKCDRRRHSHIAVRI